MTTITEATLEDIEEIVNISQVLALEIPKFRWTDQEWIKENIDSYLVIKQDRKIKGIMHLEDKKIELEIVALAISKKDQRKKLGKTLVEYAIDKAKEENIKRLTVESFYEYNVGEFYKNIGFQESKPGIFQGHPYHRFYLEV